MQTREHSALKWLAIAAAVSVVLTAAGCHRLLPSDGPSRLWPRYVQRQGDQTFDAIYVDGAIYQRQHSTAASVRTDRMRRNNHHAPSTNDYRAGFVQGYYDCGMGRLQPPGIVGADLIPSTSRLSKRTIGTTSTEYTSGYAEGSTIASTHTLAGVAPGN